MKIREIDRLNYLKNSPLKRVVNFGIVLFVGATTAYGSYIVLYDLDSLKSKINYALEVFNFEKLTDDPAFKTKITDKKVLSNAFRQYLEEKKANKSQLDEDTRRRLERLLNKNKEPATQAAPSQPVQSTDAARAAPEGRTTRLVNYTKSWYRWLVRSKPKESQEQPPASK